MIRSIALILWFFLIAVKTFAADAILYLDTPGQTLYVRVLTGPTTSVAVALTEGTGDGVGRYVVADTALAAAGLSGTAVYPYKIFVGAPSTSANDTMIGDGTIRWVATTVVDPLPNAVVATQTSVNAVDDFVDTEIATLQTSIGTIDDFLDTEIATLVTNTTGIPTTTAIRDAIFNHTLTDTGVGTFGRAAFYLSTTFSAPGEFSEPALSNGPSGLAGAGGLSFVGYIDTFDAEADAVDVVQGEEKALTIAVQANGAFADPTPETITVKFKDEDGNIVTVANADITRVLQDPVFQIIRFTLPPASTAALEPGFASAQVSIDDEILRIPDAIRIIEAF